MRRLGSLTHTQKKASLSLPVSCINLLCVSAIMYVAESRPRDGDKLPR